jgi:hypothetical protein
MCATVLALQVTMTTSFVALVEHEDSNLRRVEYSGDRTQSLGRKWVVATDDQGNRRLRMRWTVARVFPPVTVCKAARPWVEPAVGREGELTPSPQPRVAISQFVFIAC